MEPTARALDRVDAEGGLLRAGEVRLVVAIVSISSRRMDHPPVTLLACHLAGEFGYQDAGAVTGEFITSEPSGLKISLDQLS